MCQPCNPLNAIHVAISCDVHLKIQNNFQTIIKTDMNGGSVLGMQTIAD